MLRSSLRSSSEFHDAARARSPASRDAPSPEVTAANRRADEAERAAFVIEEEAAERVTRAEASAREAETRLRLEARLREALERELADARRAGPAPSPSAASPSPAFAPPPHPFPSAPTAPPAAASAPPWPPDAAPPPPPPFSPASFAAAASAAFASASPPLERALTELANAKAALERERAARVRAEGIARSHETRRMRAVESLLERHKARRARGDARATAAGPPLAKSSPSTLTTAEETLVDVEAEHLREREHLEAKLVSARAETSAAIARAAAAESERDEARSERDLVRRDADALYSSTLRSREGLGAAGVATCRLALNRLDDIEARAIGTYAVAAGALNLCEEACAATERVADVLADARLAEDVELGVEYQWRTARDVVTESWGVARSIARQHESLRVEATAVGAALERATRREAERVRTLARRGGGASGSARRSFDSLASTELSAASLAGSSLATTMPAMQPPTMPASSDVGDAPMRWTRRPMSAGGRGRPRVAAPPNSSAQRPHSARPSSASRPSSAMRPSSASRPSSAAPPRGRSPGPRPARARTPDASPLRPSHSLRSSASGRPDSAASSGRLRDGFVVASKVGAYIRGETPPRPPRATSRSTTPSTRVDRSSPSFDRRAINRSRGSTSRSPGWSRSPSRRANDATGASPGLTRGPSRGYTPPGGIARDANARRRSPKRPEAALRRTPNARVGGARGVSASANAAPGATAGSSPLSRRRPGIFAASPGLVAGSGRPPRSPAGKSPARPEARASPANDRERRSGARASLRFGDAEAERGPPRSPKPVKATMACHRDSRRDAATPPRSSQRYRDKIVGRTLRP